MDLFSPLVPSEQLHANFRNIILPSMHAERAELARWSKGFLDRDGKFVKEFQTTFNSSFWEIYLYALFNVYGFELNWAHASPDFLVKSQFGEFIVEATTANAAIGKPAEWEKKVPLGEAVIKKDFWPLNREAIIRLANSIRSKAQKYVKDYAKLDHVKARPFVLAIAPFEQPDFQYQYDRAIRAVLYDDYVDEAAYSKNPQRYPDGPPSVQLGFVEKDNGAEIPLGIFNTEEYREVSAILFLVPLRGERLRRWQKTVEIQALLPRVGAASLTGSLVALWCRAQNIRKLLRTDFKCSTIPTRLDLSIHVSFDA